MPRRSAHTSASPSNTRFRSPTRSTVTWEDDVARFMDAHADDDSSATTSPGGAVHRHENMNPLHVANRNEMMKFLKFVERDLHLVRFIQLYKMAELLGRKDAFGKQLVRELFETVPCVIYPAKMLRIWTVMKKALQDPRKGGTPWHTFRVEANNLRKQMQRLIADCEDKMGVNIPDCVLQMKMKFVEVVERQNVQSWIARNFSESLFLAFARNQYGYSVKSDVMKALLPRLLPSMASSPPKTGKKRKSTSRSPQKRLKF